MLTGTASLDAFPAGAVPAWAEDAIELGQLEVLQAMFEMPMAVRQAVLPPALHPTNPPTMTFQVWRCGESPWGPFELAQVRVQCRSGLRPRGFVVASVVDNADAGAGLAARYGFASRSGTVRLRRYYDEASAEVAVGGHLALRLRCSDPDPLGPTDVAYSSTLHLAETPSGLRLVQLDLETDLDRAERVRPALERFDAEAWGAALVEPRYAVSASIAVGRATLPAVRYVCRPDVLAFEGTESVRRSPTTAP